MKENNLNDTQSKILLIIKDKALIDASFKNININDINELSTKYYNCDNDLFKYFVDYFMIECSNLTNRDFSAINDILLDLLEKIYQKDMYKIAVQEARSLSDTFELNLYNASLWLIRSRKISTDILSDNIKASYENIDMNITKKATIKEDTYIYDSKYDEWHYFDFEALPNVSKLSPKFVEELSNIIDCDFAIFKCHLELYNKYL